MPVFRDLPKVVLVDRKYDCPEFTITIPVQVDGQLGKIFGRHDVPPGSRIGVCAGSRGIGNLREITRSAVDGVRARGHTPVILPAMGSHGGATAQGQLDMLADPDIDITETSMACEIDADMETVLMGDRGPFAVHWARSAMACDFILLINRIKVHTEIFAVPEHADLGVALDGCVHSGLMKMLAVGLGKHLGAQTYHAQIPTSGRRANPDVRGFWRSRRQALSALPRWLVHRRCLPHHLLQSAPKGRRHRGGGLVRRST